MINTNNERYGKYLEGAKKLFARISEWADDNLVVNRGYLKNDLRSIVQNPQFLKKEGLDGYIEFLDDIQDVDTREVELMVCEFFDEFLDVIEDQLEDE